MILVIDDVKEFPFPKGTGVIYARNLVDGILCLSNCEALKNGLDELWLDHDLGVNLIGEEVDIRPICLMLADRAFNGNPYPVGRIVICSLNPVGVDWMWSTLSKYYIVEICNDPEMVFDLLGSNQAKWY